MMSAFLRSESRILFRPESPVPASKINFEEDITRIIPKSDKSDVTAKVLQQLKFSDKITVIIEKDKEEYLSDRAKRQLKNLMWYPTADGDHNIGVDLSNARKPDAGDRASAVKLIKYMNDNGFKSTMDLKNYLVKKWDNLKKI